MVAVPASLYLLSLTVLVHAADGNCEPPRHEQCRAFVAAIVLGAVLGFLLCLVIFGFIFWVLRRRRRRELGFSEQVEMAADTLNLKDLGKELGKDENNRRSQSGNTGTVHHISENTRSIALAFEGDIEAAPGALGGEGNVAAHSAVKNPNKRVDAFPGWQKMVGETSEVSRLSPETKLSPISPGVPAPTAPPPPPPNPEPQAQPLSQPDSLNADQIQHDEDPSIDTTTTRPCRCRSNTVGGFGVFFKYPLVSTTPVCGICERRIESISKAVPRQDLKDKAQQTDFTTGVSGKVHPKLPVELGNPSRKSPNLPSARLPVFVPTIDIPRPGCEASCPHFPSIGTFNGEKSHTSASQQREVVSYHSRPSASNLPPRLPRSEEIAHCDGANPTDSRPTDGRDVLDYGVLPVEGLSDQLDGIRPSDSLAQIQPAEVGPVFMRPSEMVAFESEAVSVDPPAPTLATPAEFQSDIDAYVSTSDLEMFYTANMNTNHNNWYSNLVSLRNLRPGPGPTYLHAIAQNAAALRSDPTTSLGTQQNIHRLTRLALYHPIIFCDDSSSMSGTPFEIQRQLVSRIANVTTRIVPPGYGLDLYFINSGSFHNLNPVQIHYALETVKPSGWTPIGTNLRSKILKPLVYDVMGRGDGLKRPLLVCIITDGCPTDAEDTFKEAIVECRRFIQGAGYKSSAVRFSISQIGMDMQATRFLDTLRNDREIKDIIRVTTDRVDEKYEELRKNEKELDTWLLKVLTNPIMERGGF